tara:strand:+ start:18092 stop:20608 length:2517 start_codon:yes stop_codon:yes gene_type:complete
MQALLNAIGLNNQNKQNIRTGVINWNVIQAHIWTDALYDHGIKYIESSEIPEGWSEKRTYLFKQRMKPYSIMDNTLVLVDHHIPRWLMYDGVPIQAYTGELPVVYKVAKESIIKNTLESYLKDPMLTGYSRDALYDKVVRDKWLGISKREVDTFLKNTDMISKGKAKFKAPIVKSYRPLFPVQHWQIDLIDMQAYADNNQFYSWIVVIIDIFSKFVYVYPIMKKEPKFVVNILNRIFLNGDIPKMIQHDDGTEFKGDVTKLLKDFKVKDITNAPYSPHTNGFVENKNKQIKNYIITYMTSRKTERYYDVLDRIAFNINNTKHSVTKMTPFQIHRGIDIDTNRCIEKMKYSLNPPEHLRFEEDNVDAEQQEILDKYVESAKKSYDRRVGLVKGIIHRVADKRERVEEQNAFNHPLVVGDKVRVGLTQFMNPGRKPIHIELRDQNGLTVQQLHPEQVIPKTVIIDKKTPYKMYDYDFVIHSVIKQNNKQYYLLSTKVDNERLFVHQKIKQNVFSDKMYRSQLYLIKNPPQFIPHGKYPYVDPDNPYVSPGGNNNTPVNNNVGSTSRITRKNAERLLNALKQPGNIQKFQPVYITIAFVLTNVRQITTLSGEIVQFKKDKKWKIKIYDPESKYTEDKNVVNKDGYINLESDLNFGKYNVLNVENGWTFTRPETIRSNFPNIFTPGMGLPPILRTNNGPRNISLDEMLQIMNVIQIDRQYDKMKEKRPLVYVDVYYEVLMPLKKGGGERVKLEKYTGYLKMFFPPNTSIPNTIPGEAVPNQNNRGTGIYGTWIIEYLDPNAYGQNEQTIYIELKPSNYRKKVVFGWTFHNSTELRKQFYDIF